MAIRRLRDFGGGADTVSAGVTLPKEDLPEEIILQEEGGEELVEQHARIERVDDDRFVVELL